MTKRLKGRQLGTAYGEREHQKARAERKSANLDKAGGMVGILSGARADERAAEETTKQKSEN